MKYDFDKIVDRRGTNSMCVDGYREYLFSPEDELKFRHDEDDLIRMWVADMEFTTAPEIISSVKERLDHGIFGYTKVFDPHYLQSFLDWTWSRYNWKFKKEHVVTSHGVVPALYDLVEHLCKPGEKVLIMTPSYGFFKRAVEFHNISLEISELIYQDGHYVMDFEQIAQIVNSKQVVMCIFCNPHNPTGRVWSVDELRKFGEMCLANEVTIISDEVHCDILRKGQEFTPLAKLFPETDRIITCMSPSKAFNMAGFMLANIIIPNDEVRALWKDTHLSVDNPLSITAAQAAYTSGHGWLREMTAYLDDNFAFLQEYLSVHLPKARFTIPEATYLAWINVSAYFDKEENLTLFFANKAGVLLEGGNLFVSNGKGFIRLNLACPRSRLEQGLDRAREAILTSFFSESRSSEK